jgi:hypothetical protein
MHNAKKITEKLLESQRLISEEIEEEKEGSRTGKLLRKARLGVRVAILCMQHAEDIHDFGIIDE